MLQLLLLKVKMITGDNSIFIIIKNKKYDQSKKR